MSSEVSERPALDCGGGTINGRHMCSCLVALHPALDCGGGAVKATIGGGLCLRHPDPALYYGSGLIDFLESTPSLSPLETS